MGKKERERAFLEGVKKFDPEFPSGQITDSESPDFIVKLDSKSLGIEIIEYVRGQNSGESALRRREVVSQKIIDIAKDKFYRSNEIPLWVIFSWYPRRYPQQVESKELADVAVWAINNNVPQDLFESVVITNDYLENTPLEKFVHNIRVTRVRNQGQALWSSVESGFTSAVSNEIQEIISSKNVKAKQYRENGDLLWLIIVSDGRHISSTASLEESALNYIYQSEFDRVIFYDHQEQKIKDLAITTNLQT